MSIPKDIKRAHPYLDDWSILVGYRGSIAHGMYLPSDDPCSVDDRDVMAIVVPPIEYYYGLKEFGTRGTKEIKKDEWDIVVYEYRKFVGLLTKGNPNVLSMLWLEPVHYIKTDDAGKLLIENRRLFANKSVYHSFTGYAYSQLHRMENWKFEGYMGQKRKALVERFGYDTKNAAHLIRLLRMGIEFLNEGELFVSRPDASQLLEIKKGLWPLEKIKAEAEHLFRRAEEAYDRSKLPNKPDMEAINKLCVDMVNYIDR